MSRLCDFFCEMNQQIVTNGVSIGTFLAPNLMEDMGPAPSLVTPESPAKFRRISMVDYLKGLFSRKLDGKSYNVDAMRI